MTSQRRDYREVDPGPDFDFIEAGTLWRDLQAGDLIPYFSHRDVVLQVDPTLGARVRQENLMPDGQWILGKEDLLQFGKWQVFRPKSKADGRQDPAPFHQTMPGQRPPASTESHWPERCTRCGRGLYRGLLKVEHEGGGCP